VQNDSCPNANHGRLNAPVGFCPMCGKVVNNKVLARVCKDEEHAKKRRDRKTYCVDCGKRIIK